MKPLEKEKLDIMVRTAIVQDIPVLIEFCKNVALESEGYSLQEKLLAQGVQKLFEDPSEGQYWILETKDTHQSIGCCFITKEWSDWNAGLYWWLQSVYIQPAYRGYGLLRVLIERLEKEAAQQGVLELRLYVHADNSRAIRAYANTGFETTPYRIMTKPIGVTGGEMLC